MVDGLYLRRSGADFDADTELSRLRIVLSRALVDASQSAACNWGGPDWDRTSDLPRVRRTLSR